MHKPCAETVFFVLTATMGVASDGRRSGENGEEMLGITLGGLPVRACG